MTYEVSESTKYQRYLKGEVRVDSWKSAWRIELERRAAEEKLNTPKVPKLKLAA